MFFLGSPSYNRDLYEAVSRHMLRDYSPTYWFRIMRAQQLLAVTAILVQIAAVLVAICAILPQILAVFV